MPDQEQLAIADHLRELRRRVDEALYDLALPREPAALYEPVRYAVEGDGKRIRPLLLLIAAEGYGLQVESALPAAIAVEVFHNFTLVHDDIMDHAASRRGRATLHTKWDESTAILSGDYMMALSYRSLARAASDRLHEVFPLFDEMVTDLCEGQALDKAFEGETVVHLHEYYRMIDSKTGALIRASLEIGAALGGAPSEERERLRQVGTHLGRAFQIQDDLLDLVASDRRWGKAVGGDLMEGKKTFLLVKALDFPSGDHAAWFRGIVSRGGATKGEIPEARRRLEEMGILEEARTAVTVETQTALQLIGGLDAVPRGIEALSVLVGELSERVH